jgi:uncharacterized coiled-coil protein SlyX
MAEREQEEVDAHAEMGRLLTVLRESPNPETKLVARAIACSYIDNAENMLKFHDVSRSEEIGGLEKKQRELDTEMRDLMINYLRALDDRLTKLEHKPATESPEFQRLKSDLAETREAINEHKATLEELEKLRADKFQKWVQTLEKKPDGR